MKAILITITRDEKGTVTAKASSDNLVEIFGLIETAKLNWWDQVKQKNEKPETPSRIHLLN